MGKTLTGAVVSLDGFIADEDDRVGPLFDWYADGDVTWSFEGEPDREFRTTQASADFMRAEFSDVSVLVIGRRLFDLTDGWKGRPAAGDHVVVVTHEPPSDWAYADSAPFTFVASIEEADTRARELAGQGDVDFAGGEIGGQALRLGLVDRIVVSQVPVLFGSGRPFFATGPLGEPIALENPDRVAEGDRVLHMAFDVRR